jgi:hypothetical protein
MKQFCLKCNKPTEYTSSKPVFCSHCGRPYIEASASSTIAPAASQQQQVSQTPVFSYVPSATAINSQNIQHPEDATYVPKIDKIDIQFNVDNLRPNRQSGEQVFNEGSRGIGVGSDFTPRQLPEKKKKISKVERELQKQKIANDFRNEFYKNGRNSSNIEP